MTKTFNTAAINTAITKAFAAAATYQARVSELQSLLAGAEREIVAAYVQPVAAKFYGAELKTLQTGRVVWAEKDCAAKRYANRLVSAIVGTSAKAKDSATQKAVRFTASQKTLAEKLLEECGGDVKRAIAALKKAAA